MWEGLQTYPINAHLMNVREVCGWGRHNIVHKVYGQTALAMSQPGSEAYHLEALRKQYFIERRRRSANVQKGRGVRPATAMELTSRVRKKGI